jgi:hypothetical protein
MIFLMNVLNREENVNIGYLGTPLAVAVIVAWSLLLSDEGKYSRSEVLKTRYSVQNQEDVQRLRLRAVVQRLRQGGDRFLTPAQRFWLASSIGLTKL